MKTGLFGVIAVSFLGTVPALSGCDAQKKDRAPATYTVPSPTLPSPAVPAPLIPAPPPMPVPELDPSPGQSMPSPVTPDSSPTSPAPDASPSKLPE